jgi:hypothetical protein
MEKEFVSYEQALQLKELGFDEPTSFYWENNTIKPLPMKDEVGGFHFNRYTNNVDWISAPLKQQVLRWFRDKYNLVSWVYIDNVDRYFYTIIENGRFVVDHKVYPTYEEAEDACINKLIEIIKEK